MPPAADLAQLRSLIQAANAGWMAGVTSVSELPQQGARLGYRGATMTSSAPRVYRHVTGGVAGGRCVCVAGYNDAGGFLDLQEQLGHRLGRVTKLLH